LLSIAEIQKNSQELRDQVQLVKELLNVIDKDKRKLPQHARPYSETLPLPAEYTKRP
jgi:hypothetical protein